MGVEPREAGKWMEGYMKQGTIIGVSVEETKQAEETQSKWSWVEPCVWTPSMLTALQKGVKGGKWFSLIDKVFSTENLRSAWAKVASNKGAAGVDGVSIARFKKKEVLYLTEIQEALKGQSYVPDAVKRCQIPKPGTSNKRPLGIPTVKDRIVQTAIKHVLEPIFEASFTQESYGFRPNRGPKDALRRVDTLLKTGYTFVVDADIKSYFDTIDHELLMELIKVRVADSRCLKLLADYLSQDIMSETSNWKPEGGTPQGAVISPLLANIYLTPVDVAIKKAGFKMVRYADDFVILCESEDQAHHALKYVKELLTEARLMLNKEKTKIANASKPGGFDFLGYHFEQGRRIPCKKSLKKFKDKLRSKTKRTCGKSMRAIVEEINPILRGWFEYFKHSHKWTFKILDGWIRMRLRSILRKRDRRQGVGRGYDHQRWPNAFFAELGLFTLKAAHQAVCQSRCGNH